MQAKINVNNTWAHVTARTAPGGISYWIGDDGTNYGEIGSTSHRLTIDEPHATNLRLGMQVKAARLRQGIDAQTICDHFGKRPQWIHAVEQGRFTMAPHNWQKLADFVRCELKIVEL